MTDTRGSAGGLRIRWPILILGALAAASLTRIGPAPRLGPFLDPGRGIWSVAAQVRLPGEEAVTLAGLDSTVQVITDDRGVPHIFAASEEDAYRALGWLVARDRLFQLELTARAGEGSLTGLLGRAVLPADRRARGLGLAWSAERKYAALDSSSIGFRAIGAYAEGINAYIDGMGAGDLPFEYHLLGAKPRRWEPVHTAYLFARMGWTLASGDPADRRLAVAGLVGGAAAEALVPVNDPIQEPIQPSRNGSPRRIPFEIPGPAAADSIAARGAGTRTGVLVGADRGDGDAIGSNNWAVGPNRSASGHALLAGDPHLELTLPSIWYEAHIVVPGTIDVAGVTLPGSPGVVIGFNRDVAWTFTNTGGDVLDLYRETVDDAASPARYQLDGVWHELTLRVETYIGPGDQVLAVDTVRYSHRGPLQHRNGDWLSLRWTVHDPSREVDLFLQAGRSRTADEWLELMKGYHAPTQNGLVADRSGIIAIRSSGAYPVRPGDGRGDGIREGSTSASDWLGLLPVEWYPQSRNPAQGYLASANQQPVDPLDNPNYLGADWPGPWRALRINTLLRADSAVTPDAMRRYQTDPGSARADAYLPAFLAVADRLAGTGDTTLARVAALLREWDGEYTPDNRRAVLFELAMDELNRRTWDELIPAGEERSATVPAGSILLALLEDGASPWWDDRRTGDHIESRDEVVAASLVAAHEEAVRRHGDPDGEGWTWSRVRTSNVYHLLQIPALSRLELPVRGGPGTLAPLSGRGVHGASWRMVVELGDPVRAMATYPGGQSGNPVSPWYDDRIADWVAGTLDTVLVPVAPDGMPADRVRSRLTLRPRP